MNVTGVETSSGNIVENGNQIRLYYHMDYLGTADYLTSPVRLKVTSWTHYNEWGEITHNAVLKCGQRELDMVKRYGTHDYDAVLNMFYAKARFYDADNRRFASVDPILEPSAYDIAQYVDEPVQLVQYLYVKNAPLTLIDPLGLVSQRLPFPPNLPTLPQLSSFPSNEVEYVDLKIIAERYGGKATWTNNYKGKEGAIVTLGGQTKFYPLTTGIANGVHKNDNGTISIPFEVFENDWLKKANDQNRMPYVGTVLYAGEKYTIYVPEFKKGIDYDANGVLKPEASNASFALKGYEQDFSEEITITWTDWAGFFAGQGPTKIEDDPTEDKGPNSQYKNVHKDMVVGGVFEMVGLLNTAAGYTHHYTVRVTGYKSQKDSERFATIELKDNDLAQIMINNAGGYYTVLNCFDNGINTRTYTQVNLSESRKHDQYLHYLYMKDDTMHGQPKKYSGDSIQIKEIYGDKNYKVIETYNYSAALLGSNSLEEKIKSELSGLEIPIRIYSN